MQFSLTAGSSCAISRERKKVKNQGCLPRPTHIMCSLEKLISPAIFHCMAYPACLKPHLIIMSTFHLGQRGTIILDKAHILFLH